ncbi:M20 aminoacylase family protein [Pseudooctadecabacter jejudonensis]|uniref:Putative hydrolase YxeP n=1 Tax=Pseudooctadecabacter jejudonensis TaxID=1391910 RepID=A0A1Y5RJD6_9RHOB|nr:M20 aminoacylase family protein [Pseudooctadecabacter jejudonensis]SLN18683.1 putative hydrolase YxeP [Pseudooctadecabacter jejudonensis]
MPIINRIAGFADDMTEWRRHLHQHPELGQDCHQTAAYVVERLRDFGITEIHQNVAVSGVIAVIEGQGEGPTIGLRADMDALPIAETTGADWASKNPGKMHACGHDGHTTMLLGAAKYLAETRNFAGRVVLIFQPAEETGGGAELMVEEGVLDRFGIRDVYALHNAPGTPVGEFYTTPGPIMAAVDTFHVDIKGEGGHGAYPQETRDPIPPALSIAQAMGTIVSRNHRALDELVVSVTMFHAGTADNIIPEDAYLGGTVRTFDKDVQAMVKRRMAEIVEGHARAFNVEATLRYEEGFPPTINTPQETSFAVEVAREVAAQGTVTPDVAPEMGAEDFAYFLNERPGCYLFVGNGDTAGLHQPNYDFDDNTAPYGASFFARVAERALPLGDG